MSKDILSLEASALRQALADLPSTQAQENLTPPKLAEIYVPHTHPKALSPDVSIVVGMRGAGKSFWTAVLADDRTRGFVLNAPQITGASSLIVRVGFGLDLSSSDFPSAQSISELIEGGYSPDDIWRAVLLRHALNALKKSIPFAENTVDSAIQWVKDNPKETSARLTECDRVLSDRGETLLLLFDSLDRLAGDWDQIRKVLSAALKLCLECRSRRAIRLKFFLRPDMVEEEDKVWQFADSSKLLHGKLELSWRPNDLFSLVLLYLVNSKQVGDSVRSELGKLADISWQERDGAFLLPAGLAANEQLLRSVVEALASQWVGTSAKRGYTYTWIPTHLADAKGRLSPRSILLAFKHAAEWTLERQPGFILALHYEGIQHGVTKASEIRIGEIKEDYPWVGPLLNALKGATVPLSVDELCPLWPDDCLSASIEPANLRTRLPPRRYSVDGKRDSLVDDLIELAVMYRTTDKRLNMPDIFRVGFGIKRKGGVKPPR